MPPKAKKLHENQYLAGLWQLEGAARIPLVSLEIGRRQRNQRIQTPERRGNVVLTVFLA
jgi:hypothetical protein